MNVFSKKYHFFLFAILLTPIFIYSQNAILIFNEDFETGNYPFIADSSFGNPLGVNTWIVNADGVYFYNIESPLPVAPKKGPLV